MNPPGTEPVCTTRSCTFADEVPSFYVSYGTKGFVRYLVGPRSLFVDVCIYTYIIYIYFQMYVAGSTQHLMIYRVDVSVGLETTGFLS